VQFCGGLHHSNTRADGHLCRSLNIFPTEKQLQRWINEIEEEEPTGFIVYDKFEALAVRLLTVCAHHVLGVFFLTMEE
jgi:hypothetical protein